MKAPHLVGVAVLFIAACSEPQATKNLQKTTFPDIGPAKKKQQTRAKNAPAPQSPRQKTQRFSRQDLTIPIKDATLHAKVFSALDDAFLEHIDVMPRLSGDTKITIWEDSEPQVVAIRITANGYPDLAAVRITEPDSLAASRWYGLDGRALDTRILARPLAAGRVTSKYGVRFHPIKHRKIVHRGVDYGAPTGTPVWAVADGKVKTSRAAGGAGNLIVIAHAAIDAHTKYMHLSKRYVRTGDHVRKGQVIGEVGATGSATGPHLHYEKYESNFPVDTLKTPSRTQDSLGPMGRTSNHRLISTVKNAP